MAKLIENNFKYDSNVSITKTSVDARPLTKIREISEKNRNQDISYLPLVTLYGKYPQNKIEVRTYDISNIQTVPYTTFEFILKIKNGNAIPKYYTSIPFFQKLEQAINTDDVYFVNQRLDNPAIVTIDIAPLIEKVKNFRTLELQKGVVVTKNVLLKSQATNESFETIIETILFKELVQYINWVVSKPNPNYDLRLLSVREIGESILFEEEEIPVEEDTTTPTPPTDGPPNPLNEVDYPPIGREGLYIGEIAQTNSGTAYEWSGLAWKVISQRNSIGSGGGGPDGSGPGSLRVL